MRKLTDTGSTDSVTFWFPASRWTFTASFVPLGDKQAAEVDAVDVTPSGNGDFTLVVPDLTGHYRVDVFGNKAGGRSVAYSFAWTAPSAG